MKWQSVALLTIVTVLASGAIALAGPIGPSAQSSTNPIRAFTVQGETQGKLVYTVPAGQVFVITDLVLSRSKPGSNYQQWGTSYEVGCLLVNNVKTLCTDRANYGQGTERRPAHLRLATGTPVAAGSKVSLLVDGHDGGQFDSLVFSITGYLARP